MKVVRNYIQPKLTVLVFGATGLVGKQLVKILLKDYRYGRIIIANRKKINYREEKIQEVLVDFNNLQNLQDYFDVNHVFICLGTTIRKAGSKEQFEKVDLDYPIEIATIAELKNVSTLVHISALGANKKSSNFYLKTKGKVQENIDAVGPDFSFAVQPSMLLGDRSENRIGESIGKYLVEKLEFLMVGKLKKYRGIKAIDVASAMIEIANEKPAQKHILSEDLKVISKYNTSK